MNRILRAARKMIAFLSLSMIGASTATAAENLCADTASKPQAADAAAAKVLVSKTTGARLMRIPAGEYLRGTSDAQIERMLKDDPAAERSDFDSERPQHTARITKAFYLGRTEVTQAEWKTVMKTDPSFFPRVDAAKEKYEGLDTTQFPVENVSWYDAVEYCNTLSEQEGLPAFYSLTIVQRVKGEILKARVTVVGGSGYRLPTEAEWEYACRAGSATAFHFGDENDGKAANIDGNALFGTVVKGPMLNRPSIVGSYAANAFGLVDMHGNVGEWCQDWYDRDVYRQYASKVAVDPLAEGRDLKYPVFRGGAWNEAAIDARSARRQRFPPEGRGYSLGFRLARTP